MKFTTQAVKSISAFEQMFPDLIVIGSWFPSPDGYGSITLAAKLAEHEPEHEPQNHTPGASSDHE